MIQRLAVFAEFERVMSTRLAVPPARTGWPYPGAPVRWGGSPHRSNSWRTRSVVG
jgi:hypothetical protein